MLHYPSSRNRDDRSGKLRVISIGNLNHSFFLKQHYRCNSDLSEKVPGGSKRTAPGSGLIVFLPPGWENTSRITGMTKTVVRADGHQPCTGRMFLGSLCTGEGNYQTRCPEMQKTLVPVCFQGEWYRKKIFRRCVMFFCSG
jgi:hypothetical protein